jgi:hypothetical protein
MTCCWVSTKGSQKRTRCQGLRQWRSARTCSHRCGCCTTEHRSVRSACPARAR